MAEIYLVFWNISSEFGGNERGVLSVHKTQDSAIAAVEKYNATAEDESDYANLEVWEIK